MVHKRMVHVEKPQKNLRAPNRIVRSLGIVNIDKFQNLPYPALARLICTRMGHKALVNNADLLIDATGIGEAVVDLVRNEGLTPYAIKITGGGKVAVEHEDFGQVFTQSSDSRLHGIQAIKGFSVPKADLIAAGQLYMQQDRVRCASGIPWEDDFRDQMMGFKGQLNDGGRITKAEAETEALHDDLVTCYLLGAWWDSREGNDEIEERPLPISTKLNRPGVYDPYDYC
jgi:hypothetical protein